MSRPIPCICDAAAQIRDGRTTPIELVEHCLELIRRHNDRLHAWVLVDQRGARHAAERLGRREPRGPLHGIPIGIKDIIDVAGMPTRAGSPLRENHLAAEDAPLVAALRRAGAVILGKTVTVEFACFDPSPALNPWNLQHTPGGSSSGSAVAVATGMCFGALGTQTGGSLVRPASYCGVATCKPTFGALAVEGIVPVSYHLDHPGPMARCVDDLEIMLRCLTAEDITGPPCRRPLNGQAQTSPCRRPLNGQAQTPPCRRPLEAEEQAPPRMALIEQFFMEGADRAVREVVEAALEKLRNSGARIETAAFADGFEQVQPMHRRIMAVEAAAFHRRQFAAHRESYGPLIAELLDEGLATSAVGYAEALARQRQYSRRAAELLQGLDALVVPSTETTAPPLSLGSTGSPRFQAPWSVAGLPVVSIPAGLAGDGLPVGVQLVGRRCEETALLRVARWCEQRIAFDRTPPATRPGSP